jgi:hypothetical protein
VEDIVRELYWTVLSRPPSQQEQSAAVELLSTADRRQALEDLTWALMTSNEYVLRH